MEPRSIRILPEGKCLEAKPGETILDTLARGARGLVLVGCKGGGCGICKVRVVEGVVEMGAYSVAVLSADESAAGVILACKAVPRTDLAVEAVPRTNWRPKSKTAEGDLTCSGLNCRACPVNC